MEFIIKEIQNCNIVSWDKNSICCEKMKYALKDKKLFENVISKNQCPYCFQVIKQILKGEIT